MSKHKGVPVTIRGKTYNSIHQAYLVFKNEVSVSYNTIKQRITQYGINPEKAFFSNKYFR